MKAWKNTGWKPATCNASWKHQISHFDFPIAAGSNLMALARMHVSLAVSQWKVFRRAPSVLRGLTLMLRKVLYQRRTQILLTYRTYVGNLWPDRSGKVSVSHVPLLEYRRYGVVDVQGWMTCSTELFQVASG
jgi:hypothetical protein